MRSPQCDPTDPAPGARGGGGDGALPSGGRGRTSRRRAAALAVSAILFAVPAAQARLVTVGSGGTFATLESAVNGRTYGAGDTIAVLPGTHRVTSMLRPLGSGVAGSPIVVRGEGVGVSIVSGELLTNHKALWDVEQSNSWWIFEDLTVQDMRGAQTNARGFFLVGCTDLIVQRCEVTNCWNGFMSASGAARVTIQFCDIHDNGGLQGPAHNLYLSSGQDFVVRHNWIHDAHYGTCFKDRTKNLQLLYNWIENADQGGYEVSLAGAGTSDRGEALLLGNVIVKSTTSAQRTHLIRFEDSRVGTLELVNNTVIGRSGCVVVYSIASSTVLRNNVFHLGGTLLSRDSSSRQLSGAGNWATSGMSVPSELAGTLLGSDPGFVDLAGGDLHLASGSPCIDAGDGSASPLPEWQYEDEASRAARDLIGAAIDIGAFEFGNTGAGGSTAAPDTTAPAAPNGLAAMAASFDRIALGWSAPGDLDVASYRIERAAAAEGPWSILDSASETSYEDEDLEPETTYWYRVCAVDASENVSDPSEPASATTPADLPPGAPADLAAQAASSSRIALSWTAPGDEDLEDYVIYRASAADGPFAEIGSASTTTYGATGLSASTRYWFQVRARDAGGQLSLPSGAASDSTPAAAALTVTVLKGTLVSGSGADLQGSDDVDVAVQATGFKKKWTAEFSVVGSVGALGAAPLQVDYEIGAARQAKLIVSLWRWQRNRWQNADEAKIGPTDVARSILIREQASRFVSGTGEVRVRFVVRGREAWQTFVAGLDALSIGAGVEPEPGEDDGNDARPGALPEDGAPGADETPARPALLVLGAGPQGTGVRFAVGGEVQDGVRLFDVRGREVVHLQRFVADGARRVYAWNGHDDAGRPVARGVYFARSRVTTGALVRRLVWLRD